MFDIVKFTQAIEYLNDARNVIKDLQDAPQTPQFVHDELTLMNEQLANHIEHMNRLRSTEHRSETSWYSQICVTHPVTSCHY